MSSFFNSLADKAQAAINQTPLAGRIPPLNSSQAHGQQSSSTADSTHLGGRLGGLQHQLRSLQQQYSYVLYLGLLYCINLICLYSLDPLPQAYKG